MSTASLETVEEPMKQLPNEFARPLRANLVNRTVTLQGRAALLTGDARAVGTLLLEHHEQLRSGLDLSTPKIERMLEAAMSAGALGGKINGSGGGGCMFALAPGCEGEVAEAIRSAKGESFLVETDAGVRRET